MAGEEKPRERATPEETAKDGESAWLDAHYDPVASLNTLTSCMVLEDLNCDGDYKVIFATVFQQLTTRLYSFGCYSVLQLFTVYINFVHTSP